jgi:hypothetical protein
MFVNGKKTNVRWNSYYYEIGDIFNLLCRRENTKLRKKKILVVYLISEKILVGLFY